MKFAFLFLGVISVLGLLAGAMAIFAMIGMPGKSYSGEPPVLSTEERQLADRLMRHLEMLCVEIGERNQSKHQNLERAASYIAETFRASGYEVEEQVYEIDGLPYRNIEASLKGSKNPGDVLVVGAHYDTVPGCPGADDNGTGIAALLELARSMHGAEPSSTVRFVAFTNEEYPFFRSYKMGSFFYAQSCKQKGEKIRGMIALETLGYYRDQKGSQTYPIPVLGLLPERGDFLFFVGRMSSREFITRSLGSFRERARIPSRGIAAFDCFEDISRSDNYCFDLNGYQSFMVTDTANFRNPNYHRASDLPDTIDRQRYTRAVAGLRDMLLDLSGARGYLTKDPERKPR
ncbi:MAG: M28 family peptidase [Candidatus Obscuribacterales bacterium]